jgi:VanZ family protein
MIPGRVWLTGVLLLLIVGLAAVSLGPFPQPDLPGHLELLPHGVAYAVGTYLVLTVSHRRKADRVRPWVVAVIAASMVFLGAALELAQRAVDRDVEVLDAVANSLGVGVAVVTWGVTRWMRGSAPDGER